MSVVGWREIAKGCAVSGKYGQSNQYTRVFLVRVDHPATSQVAIAACPGVVYGTPHPDQSNCVAMEFDAQASDDVGLWWTVTVRYYIPPAEKTPNEQGLPEDNWSASCSTSTGPAYKDTVDATICNSAGDPLEGIERENDDISWSLSRSYEDMSWAELAIDHSNTTNLYTWAGGAPETWKCNFKGAQKKRITKTTATGGGSSQSDGTYSPATVTEEEIEYWEAHWEFRYRKDGWRAKPWDVGFNQLCLTDGTPSQYGTERRAILGADGKAVKQPAALYRGVAKAAGSRPDIINDGDGARIYLQTDFFDFGEPS